MLPRKADYSEDFQLTGWTFGVDFDSLISGMVAKTIAMELNKIDRSYSGVSLDLRKGGVISFDMPIFSDCGSCGPAWEATIGELAEDLLTSHVSRGGKVVGSEVEIVLGVADALRAAADMLIAACDSGSGPQGENSRSEVEGEAPQSGLSESEGIAQPLPPKEPL